MVQQLTAGEKVGKNLKSLIKASIWKTQDNFATNAVFVDPTTVRRWISKGVNDLRIVEELCRVLNVALEDILS